MAGFCIYCGKKLEGNEICSCEEAQNAWKRKQLRNAANADREKAAAERTAAAEGKTADKGVAAAEIQAVRERNAAAIPDFKKISRSPGDDLGSPSCTRKDSSAVDWASILSTMNWIFLIVVTLVGAIAGSALGSLSHSPVFGFFGFLLGAAVGLSTVALSMIIISMSRDLSALTDNSVRISEMTALLKQAYVDSGNLLNEIREIKAVIEKSESDPAETAEGNIRHLSSDR